MLTTSNVGKDMEHQEIYFITCELQNGTATLKTALQFFTKFNILLPCHPATALLHIYPN